MNFFQKVGNAFSRFMYGRNGADHLGMAALWLAILLDIVNIFVKNGHGRTRRSLRSPWCSRSGRCSGCSPGTCSAAAPRTRGSSRSSSIPCSAAAAPPPAAHGQGPQILHLSQLPHGLPRPARKGQDRHHLPQVPPRNPRTELKDLRAPRQSRGARFHQKRLRLF